MQKALADSFNSQGPDGKILDKKPYLQSVVKKLAKNMELQQSTDEKINMIRDICSKYSTKSKSNKRNKRQAQIKQTDIDDPYRIIDHHNMVLDNIYDRIEQAIEMATEELQIKNTNNEKENNNSLFEELNQDSDSDEMPAPKQAPQPIPEDDSDEDILKTDSDILEEEDLDDTLFSEENHGVNLVKH